MSTSFKGHDFCEIRATLISPSTESSIDITRFVVKADLFNSIFDLAVSGVLQISDPTGLIQSIDMLGDEMVLLNLIDNKDNVFSRLFHVYGTDNYVMDHTNSTVNVQFHIASSIELLSNSRLISLGLTNTTFSNVIIQCFKALNIQQSVSIENSKGVMTSYIVPKWSLATVLSKTVNRAVSEKYDSPYVAFEGMADSVIHVKSLERIIEDQKGADLQTFTNIEFLPTGSQKQNKKSIVPEQYNNVSMFEVISRANMVQRAKHGGISNEVVVIDLLKRKKTILRNDTSNISKIVKQPIVGTFKADGLQAENKPFVTGTVYLDSARVPTPTTDTIGKREIFFQQFSQTQIGFTIPFNPALQAGSLFNFLGHTPKDPNKSNKISGRYMIANLRHTAVHGSAITVVEANRLGYTEVIDD